MVKVEQLINDNEQPTRNQFILRENGNLYFQSYNSIICRVGKNGRISLGCKWDYSNTTRKYLYTFLRDYTRYQVHSRKEVLALIKGREISIDVRL